MPDDSSDFSAPFQILNPQGELVGDLPQGINSERVLSWYRQMWITRFFSNKIVALQRQGRAGTWGPLNGQEATAVGMAAPLKTADWLTGSYRDVGAYIAKGLPIAAVTYYTRGYSAPPELTQPDGVDVHCLPVQIVIATQVLHAVGMAMAARIKGEDSVVVVGCGDGATSEGDFNEALNFAGVFKAPVVFVVVNNGWAISTPRSKQTAAQYIAHRGKGFGVPARLVDGNDIFAVYATIQEAVDRARAGEGPTLVEALTYRLGAHTTADDPTRYRPKEELEYWEQRDPITRLRTYLKNNDGLDEASDQHLMTEAEELVAVEVQRAHDFPAPAPESLFENVFAELPPRLQRQRNQLRAELGLTELSQGE